MSEVAFCSAKIAANSDAFAEQRATRIIRTHINISQREFSPDYELFTLFPQQAAWTQWSQLCFAGMKMNLTSLPSAHVKETECN